MKKLLIVLFVQVCASTQLQAQPDGGKAAREEMKKFTDWAGTWTGQGSFQMGENVSTSTVEEVVQWKLDGLVLMFEGTGKKVDPATGQERAVHNAMGFLTYNGATKTYTMKSYLADGRSTDAWFNVVDPTHYQWGFDTPMGKMKYSITADMGAKTWNEIGEFSKDGTTWKKFFEMNLKKN